MATLIIAKYREDITWIDDVSKEHKIVIYDKSDEPSEYIKLENIGRESHTWLTHIVNNYDNLDEYNVFLQGHPQPHFGNWKEFDLQELKPLGEMIACSNDGSPQHQGLPLVNVYEQVMHNSKECPDRFLFCIGAQYVVPKENILAYPKTFYQALLDMHYKEHLMPWVIERFWDLIWTNSL